MKIVILGLIGVAIVNVALAAQGDKGGKDDTENETSKAQLNMVLEQMKDLRHQLQQQQEQQHLMNKLMEEKQHLDEKQQEQLKEQQDQLKEQQRRDEELQRRNEEQLEKITKIERTRRSENKKMRLIKKSENETVEHIKELVLAEIQPVIDVLSECAIGNYTWRNPRSSRQSGEFNFRETTTISFGKTFSRKPKVIVSVAGYERWYNDPFYDMALQGTVHSPTTTKFNLEIRAYQIYVQWIEYLWIACA